MDIPKRMEDGTEVYVMGDEIEVNGEVWVTLCPTETSDERLWEFSLTSGRIVQTMEDER